MTIKTILMALLSISIMALLGTTTQNVRADDNDLWNFATFQKQNDTYVQLPDGRLVKINSYAIRSPSGYPIESDTFKLVTVYDAGGKLLDNEHYYRLNPWYTDYISDQGQLHGGYQVPCVGHQMNEFNVLNSTDKKPNDLATRIGSNQHLLTQTRSNRRISTNISNSQSSGRCIQHKTSEEPFRPAIKPPTFPRIPIEKPTPSVITLNAETCKEYLQGKWKKVKLSGGIIGLGCVAGIYLIFFDKNKDKDKDKPYCIRSGSTYVSNKTLLIPKGTALITPLQYINYYAIENYGEIQNTGTFINDCLINNRLSGTVANGYTMMNTTFLGTFNNNGTVKSYGTLKNSMLATFNNGNKIKNWNDWSTSFRNYNSKTIRKLTVGVENVTVDVETYGDWDNQGIINNHATIINEHTITNSVGSELNNRGTIENLRLGLIRNIDNGSIDNQINGLIENYGTISNSYRIYNQENNSRIRNHDGGKINNHIDGDILIAGHGSIENSGEITNKRTILVATQGQLTNNLGGVIKNLPHGTIRRNYGVGAIINNYGAIKNSSLFGCHPPAVYEGTQPTPNPVTDVNCPPPPPLGRSK